MSPHDNTARFDIKPSITDTSLTRTGVRNRTQNSIENAIKEGRDSLIKSPPGGGKSHGTAKVLGEFDEPAVYLSPLRDLYGQFAEWCRTEGLEPYILPSMSKDCESYEECSEVYRYYHRGFTARDIHYDLGLCSHDCEYLDKIPDTVESGDTPYVPQEVADVLIGNAAHAYATVYINRRVVIFDDVGTEMFIDPYQANDNQANLDVVLSHDEFPCDTPEQLYNLDEWSRELALDTLEDIDLDPAADEHSHKKAERIVETVLKRDKLDNGYGYYSSNSEDFVGVTDGNHNVFILDRPTIPASTQVLILNAFPILFEDENRVRPIWREWQLGRRLILREPLSVEETRRYFKETLNLSVHQLTKAIKPISGGRVRDKDKQMIHFVAEQLVGDDIPLISSNKALNILPDDLPVSREMNFARVRSNNEFENEDVGLILGSPHYDDEYVQRLGAFMFQSIDRDGKGVDLTYGEVGDMILTDMREHSVGQAILRFGRQTPGETTVYVLTGAIPEEIPLSEKPERHELFDCQGQVMWYLENISPEVTTTELAEELDYTRESIRNNLNKLEIGDGTVEKIEQKPPKPHLWRLTTDE